MKRLGILFACALATLGLAACGTGNGSSGNGGNAAGNAAGNEDHDHDGHGHGHGHDGESHDLGHKDLDGGYHVGASQIGEFEAGKECIVEVHVEKDGKAVSDAKVTAWIGDAEGKELGASSSGSWMADEGVFDCHVKAPADAPKGCMLWVRVRHGDADMKTSFKLHRH